MKVGIVGAGAVGTACMFALTLRGSAREIVLVNRNSERVRGAVADLQYGAVLAPHVSLRAGVIGEHGTSQVYLWSTARVAATAIPQDDAPFASIRRVVPRRRR